MKTSAFFGIQPHTAEETTPQPTANQNKEATALHPPHPTPPRKHNDAATLPNYTRLSSMRPASMGSFCESLSWSLPTLASE